MYIPLCNLDKVFRYQYRSSGQKKVHIVLRSTYGLRLNILDELRQKILLQNQFVLTSRKVMLSLWPSRRGSRPKATVRINGPRDLHTVVSNSTQYNLQSMAFVVQKVLQLLEGD